MRKYYPNDRVMGPGGVEIAVTFPEPHVQTVNYSLDKVLPGFFDELEDALAPEVGDPKLTLAHDTRQVQLHQRRASRPSRTRIGWSCFDLRCSNASNRRAHAFAENFAEKDGKRA